MVTTLRVLSTVFARTPEEGPVSGIEVVTLAEMNNLMDLLLVQELFISSELSGLSIFIWSQLYVLPACHLLVFNLTR